MSNGGRCNVCSDPETLNGDSEVAVVRSNVRRFQSEEFGVWRCKSCRSIHARDEVDLDHYYAHYPFHGQEDNAALRLVLRTFPRRLKRFGLRPHHSILDYGCGSGLLVEFLKSKGYKNATGYDSYSEKFADAAALDATYDCIIAQDLVEHVDAPLETLKTFAELAKPGALILIGTPNADAIDLSNPDKHVHTLHQPYHTHMFSKDALLRAASDVGWSTEHVYMTNYTNTLFPCANLNFALHYASFFDNNLDLAFEPIRLNPRLLTPKSLFLAFFGYFRAPQADMTVIFRTGQ